MAAMTHTITLSPEQTDLLQTFVAEGRFASIEEALEHGLDLAIQEASADDLTPAIRARLDSSLAQAQRGELIPGEQAMAKLDNLIQQLEAR